MHDTLPPADADPAADTATSLRPAVPPALARGEPPRPGSGGGEPPPRQLGRFPIVRSLRRDRNSVVYLGVDPVLNRDVVLKAVQLPPPSDATAHADAQIDPLEQAFVRQAQAAGRLAHPHIVTVYEAGQVRNLAYLAIERVNGRPLHELLASGWRPQFEHCASIAARIADAIEHAHQQDVAHGHLGPQHVLLQADGAPKVEGFGGWIDGSSGEAALVRTEKLLPYFHSGLSDEARGADVRAVVALLFMMVTGKAPAAKPAPVATLRADIPAALARLIDEGLAGNARRRTAGDLRDALTAFIWNDRRAHVAPATLGLPLTPPPPRPADQPTADAAPTSPTSSASAGAPPTLGYAPTVALTLPPQAEATAGATIWFPPPSPASPSAPLPAALKARAAAALRWLRGHRLLAGGTAAALLALLIGGLAALRPAPVAPPEADAAAESAPAVVGEGLLILDVAPWGEVIVDGRPTGVSPPLQQLKLPAGRHNIEIRHGEKAAVGAQVEIDPAQPQTIRHRFD